MTPNLTPAADLLGAWADALPTGPPPVRYAVPPPFDALDLRPDRLVLGGGAPGPGKTAALPQVAVDLLRLNPAARAVVANVEMPPTLLPERAVARLASIPLTGLTDRALIADDRERVRLAVGGRWPPAGLPPPAVRPPAHGRGGTAFGAGVIVPDDIQRSTAVKPAWDPREQLDTLMAGARGLATPAPWCWPQPRSPGRRPGPWGAATTG